MTKSLKQAPRPQNMSQLDYLWTYFGSYEVSDSLDTPNSIPTSEAVKQFVTATEVGIVELGTEELSNNKIKIFGLDANGQELTSVSCRIAADMDFIITASVNDQRSTVFYIWYVLF